jgi:glutathionylspermidine synthase
LLEYNGEAPGLVVETFGMNSGECVEAGLRDVNANSLAVLKMAMRDALQRGLDYVGGPADRALVAFAYNLWSDRGRAAARYLADVARASSVVQVVDVPIESLSLSDDHLRLQDGRAVTVLWRPCSVRYLGAALSGRETPPDECADSLAHLIRERRLAVLDAPDTSLLSSKAAQTVIWSLAQEGVYFSDAEKEVVRAYFLPTTLDPPGGGEPYVIKPAFGSEGDSITIVDPERDEVRRSASTSFQGEAQVYQQFVTLPTRNLMTEHGVRPLHLVTSCFLVSGRSSGIIFRAGGEITTEGAWVVPAGC